MGSNLFAFVIVYMFWNVVVEVRGRPTVLAFRVSDYLRETNQKQTLLFHLRGKERIIYMSACAPLFFGV